MHLPLLYISDRLPKSENNKRFKKKDFTPDIIPWLADPEIAIANARYRNPMLNFVALWGAALGSELTYFSLMSILYSSYSKKTAMSFVSMMLPSVIVNQIFKRSFKFSRPPEKAIHRLAYIARDDPTFPSGHAQNAVVLGIFAARQMKTPATKLGSILLAVIIPWSRVYLGTHYPRDAVAGALLGTGVAFAVTSSEKPFKRWWNSKPRGLRSLTVALTCLIAGFLTRTPIAAYSCAMGGGLAVGYDLSEPLHDSKPIPTKQSRILKGISGLVMFIGTAAITRPLLHRKSTRAASLAGVIVGLMLTLGIPAANKFLLKWSELLGLDEFGE